MFSKDKVAAAAQEIVDHLKMVEHIKALQDGQRDIAREYHKLSERVASIESDLRAIRAETTLAAIQETQKIINSVQGGLNDRIEKVAIQMAVFEATQFQKTMMMGEAESFRLRKNVSPSRIADENVDPI